MLHIPASGCRHYTTLINRKSKTANNASNEDFKYLKMNLHCKGRAVKGNAFSAFLIAQCVLMNNNECKPNIPFTRKLLAFCLTSHLN